MKIEEQRRRCAEFVGWLCKHDTGPFAVDSQGNGHRACRCVYLPDLDVMQAAELKARLREMRNITYDILYDEKSKVHQVTIWADDTFGATGPTEEAALCAAVAEMVQNGKDK